MITREMECQLRSMINLEKISINDIGHGNRSEGRTFRRILMALYKASCGEKVIFAVDSANLVDWTAHRVVDIISAYGVGFAAYQARRKISIIDGGSIEFVNLQHSDDIHRLRGIKGTLIEDFI